MKQSFPTVRVEPNHLICNSLVSIVELIGQCDQIVPGLSWSGAGCSSSEFRDLRLHDAIISRGYGGSVRCLALQGVTTGRLIVSSRCCGNHEMTQGVNFGGYCILLAEKPREFMKLGGSAPNCAPLQLHDFERYCSRPRKVCIPN